MENNMENEDLGTVDNLEALTGEEQAYLQGRGEDKGQEEQGQALAADGEQESASVVKMVPHQALHAEREERRRANEEKNRLSAEKARLEARLDMILSKMGAGGESQGSQEEASTLPPDPAEDMVGFMRWQAQALARQQEEQRQAQMRFEQAGREQAQEQALHALVERSRQEVADELPDVGAAIDFLRDVRDRQLTFLSSVEPQLADPQARAQMIEAEARQLIVAAANQGQNPIRLLYDLAKNNGYQAQAGQVIAGQGAGVVDKVEALASAQAGAKTLASSAGGAASTPTAEMIANMSEEEFSAWYEKNARTFNKIMGA